MMKSRPKLTQELTALQQKRRRLVRRMLRQDDLAVGTVSVVRRKCGKPNCRCTQGHGHTQVLFLFRDEDGRRHCKLIRRADESRMLRAGERYRQFREDMRQLRAIAQREKEILMAIRDLRSIEYE